MLRPSAALLASVLLFSACANSMHNKQKVEAAILDRLQNRSGLDLKTLDVSTTAVSFDKNKAFATVSFHPKGDPNVNSGMSMKYTLEDQGGKWVVTSVGGEHGQGVMGGHMGADPNATVLPPGHPTVPTGNAPHAAEVGKE